MANLNLLFLGPFQAALAERPLTNFPSDKVQALLIYLAVESRQPQKKGDLLNLLWPNTPHETARVNLEQALQDLEAAVPAVTETNGDESVPFILIEEETVQVNPQAVYFLDVNAVRGSDLGKGASRAGSGAMTTPTVDQLEEAVALYRGPFLVDFHLADSSQFESWIVNQRAGLQLQALDHLDNLAEYQLEQRGYQKAQQYAWQQLDIDRLREPAVRQLMTALAKSGQRSAAMAQYEIYRRRLEESLGVQPSAAISELYRRIQADELQQTVLRSPTQPPPDTATINPIFCYTDIESSTRLWDEHREAMLGALLQHNDLAEKEINRFDGRILHPTGDGFLIVFEQNDPLQFAISLQQRFAQADWGEIGELRIRIGLHGATAEQEGHEFFREGAWYRGSVLNHAARISDTGHGGQIVASDMVLEYCPLPPGASWQDLGQHGLKSLDDKQQIYGLLHPDLPLQNFPPLRTPANKQAAAAGSRIRGYQLGNKIGQGAFGDVYRAVQPGVGRPVAVKIIRSLYANEPEFIRRFEAEAQVIASLEHPYIVPLYDYWREADGAYLVMRYMRGGSLKALLEGGPLDFPTALAIIDQIAAALTFAHLQGYVHRDIKPANILLDEQGSAYLSDFGIVKDLSGDGQRTETGAVIGSPAYLSPEQALSQPVTPLSDQYSLAVTMYEMLTGARAFDDASPANLIIKHINEPLPLVRSSRPELPAAVDECIQRATVKDPDARYPDIPTMLRALHMAVRGDGSSYPLPKALLEADQELVNPYQGLRSFQEADAFKFFGRKALVEQLLSHFYLKNADAANPLTAENRFLAVVGPSGSGKSSVAKAGLLPALRSGAVPGSEKWYMVEMIPGTHPLEELEAALLRIAVNPPDSLIRQLQEDERGLLRALKRVLPADGSELLLLIDQFEELYTLVEDDARRGHFINSLLAALNDHSSRLRVVATLRADFYDRPLMTPGLAELMRSCMEIVPPLTRSQLEEAIVQPALQVGAMFEAGLVPAIIDDINEQPGALPLLQYALTELFERRQERLLMRAAYEEIGGVLGALGRRAEELYVGLDEAGEEAARQLFMRLVTLGEGTEDTRRRVLRSELIGLTTGVGAVMVQDTAREVDGVRALREAPLQNTAVMETVIDAYGRYRLLTFDRDPLTREPTVEVAHEALLREWERLHIWLDESRDDVRLQRSLASFTAEWTENGESAGFLLRGSRLDLLAGWAAGTTLALTGAEQTFLQSSVLARQERQAQEESRRQQELETAQKLAETERVRAEEQEAAATGLRRRAYILGGVLVVALLLAIAAFFFARQSSENAAVAEQNAALAATRESDALAEAAARATSEATADEARQAAEEQTKIAFSRELAAAAIANLDKDPERSVLLALHAIREAHTREAEEVLHLSIPNLRVLQTFTGHEDEVNVLDFSSDGSRLVTGSDDGTARVWDTASGEELLLLDGHEAAVWDVAYGNDGATIATSGGDGTARIWDAQTGEELFTLTEHLDGPNRFSPDEPNWVNAVDISPDGKTVASSGSDGFARLWDAATGVKLNTFTIPDERIQGIANVTFSPDGSSLAMNGYGERYIDNILQIIEVDTGAVVASLPADPVLGIGDFAFSPDGNRLLIGDDGANEMVRLWDLQAGTELARYTVGENSGLNFSPDGSLFATTLFDGGARLWETETGREVLKLSGHSDRVWDVQFSPDGTSLATASADGSARIWDIGLGYELLTLLPFSDAGSADVTQIAFSPDGSMLAAGGLMGGVSVWDPVSGDNLLTLPGHDEYVGGLFFSPDGTRLASGSDDNLVKVWDTASGDLLLTLTGHEDWVNNLAYSPDGKTIATIGNDAQALIWDAGSGQILHELPLLSEGWGIAYSPDSALLAAGIFREPITIWDVKSGQMVQEIDTGVSSADDVHFTPDGSKLIAGGMDGTLKIWDIGSGDLLHEIQAHPSAVWGSAVSPGGQIIATGSGDRTARLWDTESGERLLTLEGGHSRALNDAEFAPNGTHLATTGDDTVRIWALSIDELVAVAESRLTRSLTEEECQEYLHLDACPTGE